MNILCIRFEKFPYGSAPAFRAFTMAKLMADLGNKVIVVSPVVNFQKDELNDDGTYKECKLIKAISVSAFEDSYSKTIQSVLVKENIDIIFRPTSIKHYFEIENIEKQYNISSVLDSVEWYDPSNWRLQRLDPRYYLFSYLWKYSFAKHKGVVAISRLIENYYKQRLTNTVRIPTITDCNNTIYRTNIENKKVRFTFAGQLDAGKDNLDTFIEALVSVDPNGDATQLDIYGPDLDAVKRHMGKKKYLLNNRSNIIVHGRVPQAEAQKACLESDYSVFFRLKRRSAEAGFPTKLGECMTFGTPAICNDTGDISLVIKNGVNGYMLKSKGTAEIINVLTTILKLSLEEREQMRVNARRTAEKFFDYRNYKETMKLVLNEALERGDK